MVSRILNGASMPVRLSSTGVDGGDQDAFAATSVAAATASACASVMEHSVRSMTSVPFHSGGGTMVMSSAREKISCARFGPSLNGSNVDVLTTDDALDSHGELGGAFGVSKT